MNGQPWDCMGFYGRQWILKESTGERWESTGRVTELHQLQTHASAPWLRIPFIRWIKFNLIAPDQILAPYQRWFDRAFGAAVRVLETIRRLVLTLPESVRFGSSVMLVLRWRWALGSLCAFLIAVLGGPYAFAAGDAGFAYRFPVRGLSSVPTSLYAEERGHGAPVVLLHGLGGSTYSWRYIAPVLARSHRVIAIDLKGFGRSDKVFDTAYSAADQARLIAGFLIGRGLTNVTLVGHSFGGVVALLTTMELKRRDPARITRLVLIDAPALPQPLTPIVGLMQQPVLPYALLTAIPADIMTRIALGASNTQRLSRQYTEADTRAYAEPFYDAAARHAYIQTARQIAPALSPRALAQAYTRVRQRTLLVWCTNDEVVPLSTGRALASLMPHAVLEELGGCNHAPGDEAPAALANSLVRFLSH